MDDRKQLPQLNELQVTTPRVNVNYHKIMNGIISAIESIEGCALELNILLDLVSTQLEREKIPNLYLEIINVKNDLLSKGILKISKINKGSQIISLKRRKRAAARTAKGSSLVKVVIAFSLNHTPNSKEELEFLSQMNKLSNLTSIKSFECHKRMITVNAFDFDLTITFAGRAAYEEYFSNPAFTAFMDQYWHKEVKDFSWIGYEHHK